MQQSNEYIKCPICENNDTEIVFAKKDSDRDLVNVICKNCSLVYINPQPSKEYYDQFHQVDFLNNKSITKVEDRKFKLKGRNLEIKESIVSFLKEFLQDGQNILDIGCGFGVLLNLLKKNNNINVFGIELNNLEVEAAKEYFNLDLFHGSLEQFCLSVENKNKFDIIIMHHTFEHLPNPSEILEQIKELLKENGLLHIAVPNIMNIKSKPDNFFQIAHPFSYSPHSLQKILECKGFSVIKFNRNAGYPGGFELAAAFSGEKIIKLKEGNKYEYVVNYVNWTNKKFIILRAIRRFTLFWLPEGLRMKISNKISNFLKRI